jgi:lipoate---protein ligase
LISRRDVKIPGGKLLRVEVEIESGSVLRASVCGDFFAYPEELFEAAEADLAGVPADRLGETALALFADARLRILGAGPEDIARALMEAADAAQAG